MGAGRRQIKGSEGGLLEKQWEMRWPKKVAAEGDEGADDGGEGGDAEEQSSEPCAPVTHPCTGGNLAVCTCGPTSQCPYWMPCLTLALML